MSDIFILFIFLTGAIAATLFFLQGAFHVARGVHKNVIIDPKRARYRSVLFHFRLRRRWAQLKKFLRS
jgi:hypothetical protein